MKNSITIHMGASRFDVFVRDASGSPIYFDLYHMARDKRAHFHRELMRAVRKHMGAR
jgi:hypothetical protein